MNIHRSLSITLYSAIYLYYSKRQPFIHFQLESIATRSQPLSHSSGFCSTVCDLSVHGVGFILLSET